jgi:hypothetical protein
MEEAIRHAAGFFLFSFCFVLLCLFFSKITNKQPPQPSKSDKVDANLQASTFIRLNEIDNKLASVEISLRSIQYDKNDNANDLESIRRKLHELAGDVKSIKSVFAVIPTADAVND